MGFHVLERAHLLELSRARHHLRAHHVAPERVKRLMTMLTSGDDEVFKGLSDAGGQKTWGDFRRHPPTGGYVGWWAAVYRHWVAEDPMMTVRHHSNPRLRPPSDLILTQHFASRLLLCW